MLDAEHRTKPELDRSVILLDQVVQVLYGPQFTAFWQCALLLELAHRFRVGWVLVDVYDTRTYRVAGPESFAEEALSSLSVTSRAKRKRWSMNSIVLPSS